MSETALMREIRFALNSVPGVRVWRNNVGFDVDRQVRYGLAVGSADLVGVTHGGRFLALEVKTSKGRLSDDQRRWLDAVTRLGGLAAVVRSVDEALALVQP